MLITKVPSDEISPPLSSPESSDTPERKSLKSILKKMSMEDSRGHLVSVPDLKKIMRAPTIQGFVARRSKFKKSVSFQRRTLNSPPYLATLEDLVRRNGSVDETARLSKSLLRQSSLGVPRTRNAIRPEQRDYKPADGMNKILSKLGHIGVESKETSDAENLVLGVRKILQEKMVRVIFCYREVLDI